MQRKNCILKPMSYQIIKLLIAVVLKQFPADLSKIINVL